MPHRIADACASRLRAREHRPSPLHFSSSTGRMRTLIASNLVGRNPRCELGGHGQAYDDAGASPVQAGIDVDGALVRFDDAAANGEAETGARRPLAVARLTVEHVEDPLAIFRRDPRSLIADLDGDAVGHYSRPYRHRRAGRSVFAR